MPLNVAAVNNTLKDKVSSFQSKLLDALQKCRDEVAAGRGTTALQRWFGDAAAEFRKDVKERIAKMRFHLNTTNIPCQMGMSLAANNNAEATHVPTGLLAAPGMNTLQAVTATQAGGRIEIGPNFKNLPDYATSPLASFNDQDKFETLAHELSHAILGTKDETNNDGTKAYGGQRARLLVTQNVAKAKTNAENWGLFVEEFV